jgi:hypothetical protein
MALMNIIKLRRASSKVNRNGDGLIYITEEEEVTKSACKQIDGLPAARRRGLLLRASITSQTQQNKRLTH